jgi:GxxExxY protein
LHDRAACDRFRLVDDLILTQTVIGAAMRVLNTLKPGLDEKLYERALVLELQKQGCSCEQQKPHDVHYHDVWIGSLVPDLIVDHRLLVEAKVVTAFNDSHVAQMLGYLTITRLTMGLLLNFKTRTLGIKRVSLSR